MKIESQLCRLPLLYVDMPMVDTAANSSIGFSSYVNYNFFTECLLLICVGLCMYRAVY
jgi:hypothetical protein